MVLSQKFNGPNISFRGCSLNSTVVIVGVSHVDSTKSHFVTVSGDKIGKLRNSFLRVTFVQFTQRGLYHFTLGPYTACTIERSKLLYISMITDVVH